MGLGASEFFFIRSAGVDIKRCGCEWGSECEFVDVDVSVDVNVDANVGVKLVLKCKRLKRSSP